MSLLHVCRLLLLLLLQKQKQTFLIHGSCVTDYADRNKALHQQ